MKKLIAVTALTLMCGSAFAQGTGPQPQTDNMQKPGTMEKNSMKKGTMDNTTGMNSGMSKDNMKQGGASKDGQGQMNKGGMSK